MKVAGFVYLVLFAYPIVTLLTPEPSFLRWWWQTGGHGPVPAKVRERGKRNEGNLLIAKFAILVGACLLLMRYFPISPRSLGFGRDQPQAAIYLGMFAGVVLIWWARSMSLLAARVGAQAALPPFLLREPTSKILVVIVLGGFAEEFWRALSLTVFYKAGISEVSAVLLTSVVFGIGHVFSYKSFGAAVGRFIAPAVGGALLGALFLWSQTLFIPFIAHVLVNSIGANVGRRRLIAKQAGCSTHPASDAERSETY